MTTPSSHNVPAPVAPSPADLQQVFALRVRAWTESGHFIQQLSSCPGWSEPLDFQAEAHHFVVKAAHSVIAAARLTTHKALAELPDIGLAVEARRNLVPAPFRSFASPIGSLNRLVVDPAHQGNRLSALLDASRIERAHQLECSAVFVYANYKRSPSLVRLGFEKVIALENLPLEQLTGLPWTNAELAMFRPVLFVKALGA